MELGKLQKKPTQNFFIFQSHVVCVHVGCNHSAKLLVGQPETQNERLMVLQTDERVPSPNNSSKIQFDREASLPIFRFILKSAKDF